MKSILIITAILAGAFNAAGQTNFTAVTNTAVGSGVEGKQAASVPIIVRKERPIGNSESNSVNNLVRQGEPVPGIRPVPGGAWAETGLQKVFFPLDSRGREALTITMPDGRKLTCRATFLAAYDRKTEKSWLVAGVISRTGQIVGQDQVVYTNAFDSINADIRYRYTRYSLEQDILLHEAPTLPPEFDPETTQLEVWSEWLDSEPRAKVVQELDLRSRKTGSGVGPCLIEDQTLDFGAMKIGAGHAFSSHDQSDRIPVGKLWEKIDGRDWLIEAVDYQAIESNLKELPTNGKLHASARESSGREQLIRSLTEPDRPKSSEGSMLLARMSSSPQPEFVLDFVIVSSVPVPVGAISWWPGGGNANDAITGGNNNGVWTGTTNYSAGKVGQGFSFNGSSKVEIANTSSLNPTNGVTLESWIKLDPENTNSADIISKDGEGSARQFFLTYISGTRILRAHVTTTSGFYHIDGQTPITSNTWYHVAMTYTAGDGELAIYINGQLDTNGYLSGTIVPTLQPVRVGGGAPVGWSPYYFNGTIDEPAIYDRALAPSEIAAIYNAGIAGKANPNCVTAPTNIVAWWTGDGVPFDMAGTNIASWHGSSAYSAGMVSDGFETTAGDFWNGGTWLEIPDRPEFNPTNELTLEAWVYPTGFVDDHRVILGKDAEYTGRQYLLTLSSENRFRAHVWANDGTIYYFDGATSIGLNGWYHVAMTYNRTNLMLYVNGVLDGSVPGTKPLRITTQPVRIGSSAPAPEGAPYSFPGLIDEPAIYNRALTSTEITALYTAGSAGKCRVDYLTDCNRDGIIDSHTNRIDCIYPGDVGDSGALSFTVTNICAGSGISSPTLASPVSFISGLAREWVSYDCNSFLDHYETNAVSFVAGDLVFSPPIPSSFSSTGVHVFTATVTGTALGGGCSNITAIVGTLVVNVWGSGDSDYDGISDCEETASGSNPTDPESASLLRLGHWRFDNTNNWVGSPGVLPLVATSCIGITSWSTNAVKITASNASLAYRDVEPNAPSANINLRSGSVRFWFKPGWSSGTAGGVGPQVEGRMIEVGAKATAGWFALGLNPSGTNLWFCTQTNSSLTLTTNVTASVSWVSNMWHQIVLTYSSTNSSIYLDGQLLASGAGVGVYPGAAVRSQGFFIGGSASGTNQSKGAFDEVETFNYPLEASSILASYETAIALDSDGDGWPNLVEDFLGTNPHSSGSVPQGISIIHPYHGEVISR